MAERLTAKADADLQLKNSLGDNDEQASGGAQPHRKKTTLLFEEKRTTNYFL
jgi:hypothetical protein